MQVRETDRQAKKETPRRSLVLTTDHMVGLWQRRDKKRGASVSCTYDNWSQGPLGFALMQHSPFMYFDEIDAVVVPVHTVDHYVRPPSTLLHHARAPWCTAVCS